MTRRAALLFLAAFCLMPLTKLVGGSEPQVAAILDLPPIELTRLQMISNQYAILNEQRESLRLRSCLALGLKLAECGQLTPEGKLVKLEIKTIEQK